MLTQLIEDHQDCEDPDEQKILTKWMMERDKLRYNINIIPQFHVISSNLSEG